MIKIRNTITSKTLVGELIKQIKETETSHTFHLSKDLKIVVTAFRLCEVCKKFFRNGDMSNNELCFDCYENGRKIECDEQEKHLYSSLSKKK